MSLALPYRITEPVDADAVQGNFDAVANQFPLSRKSLKVESVHRVGDPDEPAFENSWVNFDPTSFERARFWKDSLGVVHLEGLVKNGAAAPSTIFVLPVGYRPGNGHIFATVANSAFARVDVAATGNVVWQNGGTNAHLSLSGIHFKQEA